MGSCRPPDCPIYLGGTATQIGGKVPPGIKVHIGYLGVGDLEGVADVGEGVRIVTQLVANSRRLGVAARHRRELAFDSQSMGGNLLRVDDDPCCLHA